MATKKPAKKSAKKTTKRTNTSTASKTAVNSGRAISIRMYNVGFGDAFLVQIPSKTRPKRNGTSLMIVITVGKANLLFPGDAQWGTWNAALAVPEWRALLKRTDFLKVGHHGSHNATPKTFVEAILPNDFAAMASTFHVDQWPNIPKAALMSALGTKTKKLVRSDQESKVRGFTYGYPSRLLDRREFCILAVGAGRRIGYVSVVVYLRNPKK